jgi:transposase-like protein
VIWQDCCVRDNDGRKLDHKTLEALRIRAVDQVGEGAHPEDVAAVLGLHRKTVYAWLAKYREGGKDALKAQPVPGRPPPGKRFAAAATGRVKPHGRALV